MAEFTKQRLEEIKQCNMAFGRLATMDEVVIMAEDLLAIMEQEPVGWIAKSKATGEIELYEPHAIATNPEYWTDAFPVYAAPQLPQPAVVPSSELLSAMEEVLRISDRDHDAWHRAREGIAACRAAMLQGAEPVQGWIPCSKRVPDTMISVLVTGDWFRHAVSFWDGASWCDLDFEPPVTHWMPLPAAPQQEDL